MHHFMPLLTTSSHVRRNISACRVEVKKNLCASCESDPTDHCTGVQSQRYQPPERENPPIESATAQSTRYRV